MNGHEGACAQCDELRGKLHEMLELAEKATRDLATVTLYAQRTTAQLRDEERENAALRRRLREGGR
jgi:hypothetical protein